MSLSDLASLGSFVSGAAVLASLVFLFFQMRQMTEQVRQAEKSQRALMQQGRAARGAAFSQYLAGKHQSSVWAKAVYSHEPLDLSEVNSFVVTIGSQMYGWEDSFLQYRSGTLDAASYETDENTMRHLLTYPSHRAAWVMLRLMFSNVFREHVDKLVEANPAILPPDISAFSALKKYEWEKAQAAAPGSSEVIHEGMRV